MPSAVANRRILIVNDDGIHAPGIALLERLLRACSADVWVVAPDEERSGASNSVSMHLPVRVRKYDERHFGVKGTPTDCVLMAVHELLDRPPDLVLSGINRGANLAEDIFYSGTVAGAVQGTLLGIPSLALSQVFDGGMPVHWETAERCAPPVIEAVLQAGMAAGTFVNINFPARPPDEVAGVAVVRQGRRPPGSFQVEPRVDARDVPYYWMKLVYQQGGFDEGTDLRALRDGAVTVCPIQLDMTDYGQQQRLQAAVGQIAHELRGPGSQPD